MFKKHKFISFLIIFARMGTSTNYIELKRGLSLYIKQYYKPTTVTANTYLPVVTSFKATADINSVKLTWNKVSGAEGYVVYRYDTAKKSFVRVTKTASNVNTYTVTKLAEGTEHKFAIRAYKTVNGKEVLSKTYPTAECRIKR